MKHGRNEFFLVIFLVYEVKFSAKGSQKARNRRK